MSPPPIHAPGSAGTTYRPDIDGLRAVAVLSVVGFHAFPDWVRGGFIGVDIFFVISGYLISTIIMGGLARNSFSFAQFYARRIRRIFPALLTVLAACLSIGWFVLFSDEYMQLGKHIFGGAGFISNFILWRESNYFDNAAYTKPLLHLWSLGIEEQFYVVWPLLLWLAWKRRANPAVITIAIITASFALNLYQTGVDRAAAFYSPLTRFWELMTGSLLAYWTLHPEQCFPVLRKTIAALAGPGAMTGALPPDGAVWGSAVRNIASLTGASLIAIGLVTITREQAFPGWWAALPTLGAALLIFAGPQPWLNRVVLSSRLPVWIGLISFPLYLWHWPLLSFARIVESQTPGAEMRMAAVLIAVALAWCTYRLIERPLRLGTRLNLKTASLVTVMVMTGLVGYQVYKQHGLDFRQVATINLKNGFEGADDGIVVNGCGIDGDERKLFAVCAHDPRKTERYALLGDSKAASIFGGLVRTSSERGRWLFIGGNNGNGAPVPVLSSNEIYAPFQKITSIALDAISSNKSIETVVLVAATSNLFALKSDTSIEELPDSKYYSAALEGLDNAVRRLNGAGKKVVLLVDNPTLPDPHDCLGRKISSGVIAALLKPKPNPACGVTIVRHLELSEKYRALLEQIASRHPNEVSVFDTLKYMCDVGAGVCLPYKNGRMLYSYTYHISDYAAGLIGRDLNFYLANR
jgi:peptidoglycan/LPS O-acetylase OafA/YrhL